MSLDVTLEARCCEHCGRSDDGFSANITHNLAEMASKAGVYKCLWRPQEIGIYKAGDLIEPLSSGLSLMKDDPDRFKVFDADNGWGTYDDFVPWIEKYIDACERMPDARISVSV